MAVQKHHYHSSRRRAFYSLMLVVGIMLIGMTGIRHFEHFSVTDSFYFTSMIVTGQGPVGPLSPTTPAGKIFTAFLAFISVGTMVTALGFFFGPFLGKLWKVGIIKFEAELEHLKHREKKED